jgi:pimeloyl-ACP methyl ester carboxylesterase
MGMVTSRRIRTRDGLELRVIRALPQMPPSVILVHGLASNARLWDGVSHHLAEAGIPTAAVDLRGHGESDRPDRGYDVANVADDVADVIGALAPDGAVLAGQSWGGNVVLECGARHPDLVEAVVCVDGGFLRLAEAFADEAAMWEVLAPPRFEELTPQQLEIRLRVRFAGWPESAVSGALANFEVGEDGFVRARLTRERHRAVLDGLWHHDPDRTLSGMTAPVRLIVAGDHRSKRARVEAFAAAGGEHLAVEWVDADHDVHAQFPSLVAEHIRSTL